MEELVNSFTGFSVSAFLFNGFFLNFYSFSFEDFLNVLHASNADNSNFFFIFSFFYSNLFVLLSYFFVQDLKINLEDETKLYNKLLNK